MDVTQLDIAIRLVGIGQTIPIMLVLIARESRTVAAAGVTVLLGVCSYLFVSSEALVTMLPGLHNIAIAMAILLPFSFWLFAIMIFEITLPHRLFLLLPGIALVHAIPHLFDLYSESTTHEVINLLNKVASITVALHLLLMVFQGRGDDLVDGRRRYRLLCLAVVGAFMLIVLGFELVNLQPFPEWLRVLSALSYTVIVLLFSIPILIDESLIRPLPRSIALPTPDADTYWLDQLQHAMNARRYAEHGLTIGDLAADLGIGEHKLRKLINDRLGYRNFSAFLNERRLKEASTRLITDAHLPVTSIALDVGFSSIGPFNRAFKLAYGITPTAYRKRGGATKAA